MSSSDRRSVLIALAGLPLAACGFTPVYGPGGSGGLVQGRVAIEAPEDRMAFALVGRLEERIGRTASAPYRLGYSIATESRGLGLSGTDDINRINLRGRIDFTVTDTASGAVVQDGTVSTFTAYATSGSPVATAAAQRDAEDRLMIALADQIVAALLSGADGWA